MKNKLGNKERLGHIIEWKAIEGLRHILVHDYFGVDLIKIWSFYKQLLPGLKLEITKLYKEFE